MKRLWITCLIMMPLCLPAQSDKTNDKEKTKETEPFGAMVARCSTNAPSFLLPLRATDIEMQISPGSVLTTISQTFTNDTALTLEAIYLFPLPSRATLSDMSMRIGDRRIRSVVQEKKEAKKTYEAAKASGKRASMVTRQRPNVFTTSLANLHPDEAITVELTYFEPTAFDEGAYRLAVPLVVGERYIPMKLSPHPQGGMQIQPTIEDADAISGPIAPRAITDMHQVSFRATTQGLPIEAVTSPTHAIDVKRRELPEETWRISLARGTVPADCDIALQLKLRAGDDPCPTVVSAPTADDGFYGMASIFPPAQTVAKRDAMDREVIFVVDTSGSMQGDSISQAKAGLKACLKRIRPGDGFTIVRFASDVTALSPKPRDATQAFIETAEAYIDGLNADGGTEIMPALDFVFSMPTAKETRLPIVILLTDACVGNDNAVMELVTQKLGRRRLFTIGIGSASNDYLIRRIAELGRGQARFIRSHEQVFEETLNLFTSLDSPVITDISLSWETDQGEAVNPAVYPTMCPDLFASRPIQILFHHESPFTGMLTLSGQRNGQPVKVSIRISPTEQQENRSTAQIIPRLFARRKIDALLQGMNAQLSSGQFAERKAEVVEIAIRHQLMSPYTARIAVEERVEHKPDGSLTTVEVPRSIPRGWYSLRATASWEGAYWIAAALFAIIAGILAGSTTKPGTPAQNGSVRH